MFNSLSSQSLLAKILPSLAAVSSLGFVIVVQLPASAAALTPVNVELSLLVDVSDSVDAREYELQMQGYRDAFTALSSEFGSGGDFGSVAVNLIQWSGAYQQQESIPWTLLNSQASTLQFADALSAVVRRFYGNTAPGSAIQFAVPLFSSNAYEGERWVIDVSGDGASNVGVFPSLARDNALAAGVSAINGLPILPLTFPSTLDDWYANNIQGGDGSFTIAAKGFEDVGRALEQKLRRELTVSPTDPTDNPSDPISDPISERVPEPSALLGIALVGGGLAYSKRRRFA